MFKSVWHAVSICWQIWLNHMKQSVMFVLKKIWFYIWFTSNHFIMFTLCSIKNIILIFILSKYQHLDEHLKHGYWFFSVVANYLQCFLNCPLTKEMQAASSKILTNRSSNCSMIRSQMDFPKRNGNLVQSLPDLKILLMP